MALCDDRSSKLTQGAGPLWQTRTLRLGQVKCIPRVQAQGSRLAASPSWSFPCATHCGLLHPTSSRRLPAGLPSPTVTADLPAGSPSLPISPLRTSPGSPPCARLGARAGVPPETRAELELRTLGQTPSRTSGVSPPAWCHQQGRMFQLSHDLNLPGGKVAPRPRRKEAAPGPRTGSHENGMWSRHKEDDTANLKGLQHIFTLKSPAEILVMREDVAPGTGKALEASARNKPVRRHGRNSKEQSGSFPVVCWVKGVRHTTEPTT